MHERILSALAVFGQFIALFPFVVVTEGVGFGEYVWWHYAAMYGGIAVFYISGRLLGCWAEGGGFSRKIKPLVMFLSRTGFVVPAVVFCVICAVCGFHTGLYLYLLPGSIAGYFGGYLSAGKSYSDIFTRGWFAAFFVAAVIGAILLGFTRNDGLYSGGIAQLCVCFGVMIITAAILTNQTNIDAQTRQRSGGAVLPKGTRSYNAWLIAAGGAVVIGVCLFAKPVAEGLMFLIRCIVGFLLSLIRGGEQDAADDGGMDENTAGQLDYALNDNMLMQLLLYLMAAGLVVLAVKFRRQIWAFIKDIFAPLFKIPLREEAAPFVDEYSDSEDVRISSRERRRNERELQKRYRRETDPVLKYRAGYELFLTRLSESPFPQLPTDTTTLHGDKGDRAFGARLPGRLDSMVEVYNRVRYGGGIPDNKELEQLDWILRQLYN